jgi:hypothetical protein
LCKVTPPPPLEKSLGKAKSAAPMYIVIVQQIYLMVEDGFYTVMDIENN